MQVKNRTCLLLFHRHFEFNHKGILKRFEFRQLIMSNLVISRANSVDNESNEVLDR